MRRPELEQALERLQAERAAETEEHARRTVAADAKVQDLRSQLEEESRAAQENARRLQQAEAEYTALVVKSVRGPHNCSNNRRRADRRAQLATPLKELFWP